MTQFRLLKRTRQLTEYSCGASALQSVASHWGREVEEDALMRLMGTNAEIGTFPEDMVRGARALGLEAELKENTTLDEVGKATAGGHPVIALAQLWRSEKDTPLAAADEWDCGHYIVILSVDREHVYFQDPYISMGKGFVPRQTFEEHWHQIMGGSSLARSPRLMRVAIYVSGGQRAMPASGGAAPAPRIDFGGLGSMSLVTVGFRRHLLPFDFLDELRGFDEGAIRAAAFLFLRKDAEGRVSAMQGGRVREGPETVHLNALIAVLAARGAGEEETMRPHALAAVQAAAAGDFGLTAADMKRRAERLSPETSEIVLLIENVWERRLEAVAARHDGRIAEEKYLQRPRLNELGRELSKGQPSSKHR